VRKGEKKGGNRWENREGEQSQGSNPKNSDQERGLGKYGDPKGKKGLQGGGQE